MDKFLKEIIKEAGNLALSLYKEGIARQTKTTASDFVTEADVAVSDFIIKKIKEKYPDHGILSEEEKEIWNPGAEYLWVIDPIDGTRNFAEHISVWCTLIGLVKNGEPFMGAVYDALHNELFFAEVGQGTYLNGQRIQVRECVDLEHSFVAFCAGMRDYVGNDLYERFINWQNNAAKGNGMFIHNYGTMLPVCHLAAGRMDAFVEDTGKYHDYVAPYVIATEAGALWTNSYGKKWQRGENDVVVANPILHKKLLELF